jgi:hypothetical protein
MVLFVVFLSFYSKVGECLAVGRTEAITSLPSRFIHADSSRLILWRNICCSPAHRICCYSHMLLRLPFLILSTTPVRTKSLFILTRSMTTNQVLNRITPDQVGLELKDPVDPTALVQAKAIIGDLIVDGYVGSENLLEVAKRLKDVPDDATKFVVTKEECKAAFEGLSDQERTALVNIHGRIKAFADMQRMSVTDMEMDIPGGKAGHIVSPCKGTYVEPSVESNRCMYGSE